MRLNLGFIFLFFSLIFTSCAGYRYTQADNPLRQYGIDSLSIPMFYNHSSLPEVSSSFTRETYKLLSGFSGLKLSSGWNKNSDALLVWIVRSQEKLSDTLRSQNQRVAQSAAPKAIGETRPEFYVPGSTNVNLSLQVIVIKKPTDEELSLLQSELGPKIPPQGKIVFNETFSLSETFLREIFDEEATSVVGTQNAGALRRTKDSLAAKAAQQIRDMILYAF